MSFIFHFALADNFCCYVFIVFKNNFIAVFQTLFIKAEQIADLIAIGQAIKDGDTTIEDVFHIITKPVLEKKKEYKTAGEIKKDQLAGILTPDEARELTEKLKNEKQIPIPEGGLI